MPLSSSCTVFCLLLPLPVYGRAVVCEESRRSVNLFTHNDPFTTWSWPSCLRHGIVNLMQHGSFSMIPLNKPPVHLCHAKYFQTIRHPPPLA